MLTSTILSRAANNITISNLAAYGEETTDARTETGEYCNFNDDCAVAWSVQGHIMRVAPNRDAYNQAMLELARFLVSDDFMLQFGESDYDLSDLDDTDVVMDVVGKFNDYCHHNSMIAECKAWLYRVSASV